MLRHRVQTGMTYTRTFQVLPEWQADRMGSGEVPVLATPAIVIAMEMTAVSLVAPHLAPGATTVGSRVDIVHLAPTAPGSFFTVELTVSRVEKNRLEFVMKARDEAKTIATGFHRRHVVDAASFMDGLHASPSALESPTSPPEEVFKGSIEDRKTQVSIPVFPFDDGETRT